VLIVSLLDGHVVALDQSTGRILWNFDSGAPLVSAKQSLTASQGLNVFPGTDGGLYAYHGITHLNPGLEVRTSEVAILSWIEQGAYAQCATAGRSDKQAVAETARAVESAIPIINASQRCHCVTAVGSPSSVLPLSCGPHLCWPSCANCDRSTHVSCLHFVVCIRAHSIWPAVCCYTRPYTLPEPFSLFAACSVFPTTSTLLFTQRLPISLPELVESAPSMTADGSILLGSRDSKVFLLDRRTGRSVQTLSNAAALEDHSSSLGKAYGATWPIRGVIQAS
jgi:hypothetical protein